MNGAGRTSTAALWRRHTAAAVALVTLHLLAGHPDYTLWDRLLAAVCAVFVYAAVWQRDSTERAVGSWVLLQYYVFYAMPVFFPGESAVTISFSQLRRGGWITAALAATVLYVAAFGVAWRLVRRPAAAGVVRWPAQPGVRVGLVFAYGVAATAITHAVRLYEYEIIRAWYTYALTVLFSPLIAQGLLLYALRVDPTVRGGKAALAVLTGLMAFSGMLAGRLDYVLGPLLTAGVGWWVIGMGLPRRLVALVAVVLVVINPAKLVYRELAGFRTDTFSTLSTQEMVATWLQSIEQVWTGDTDRQEQALETTAKRLNYLTLNALVMHQTAYFEDYALGAPWSAIPISLVPRALWPNKPGTTEITNDAFAVHFGIATWKQTEKTTFAYPGIADGFWNFGWLGVVLGGLLAGVFWRLAANAWHLHRRYRFVVVLQLLMVTRAAVSLPNLLIGVVQMCVATWVVVQGLAVLSGALRTGASRYRRGG